jgi:hypothetical protein
MCVTTKSQHNAWGWHAGATVPAKESYHNGHSYTKRAPGPWTCCLAETVRARCRPTRWRAPFEPVWFSAQAIAGLHVGVLSVNPKSSADIAAMTRSAGVDPGQNSSTDWMKKIRSTTHRVPLAPQASAVPPPHLLPRSPRLPSLPNLVSDGFFSIPFTCLGDAHARPGWSPLIERWRLHCSSCVK